jgi:transglutaminase-like putative cysteine protease
MRISIQHATAYSYDTPATRAIEVLRLSPRGHDGQFIVDWRIEVDRDCRLEASRDAFGNVLHTFTVEGGIDRLTITASGLVETEDRAGIVSGQTERFPPSLFLRETALTRCDDAIRGLAEDARGAGAGIPLLHALMTGLNDAMTFDVGATEVSTTAAEALRLGHGVCQDFSHIFIAAARHLGVPARYVSGYLYREDSLDGQAAGHGWAEVFVAELGWVGFDAANGICPTDAYVRMAIGLDYLGAAPIRGTRYGGAGEQLDVRILVRGMV